MIDNSNFRKPWKEFEQVAEDWYDKLTADELGDETKLEEKVQLLLKSCNNPSARSGRSRGFEPFDDPSRFRDGPESKKTQALEAILKSTPMSAESLMDFAESHFTSATSGSGEALKAILESSVSAESMMSFPESHFKSGIPRPLLDRLASNQDPSHWAEFHESFITPPSDNDFSGGAGSSAPKQPTMSDVSGRSSFSSMVAERSITSGRETRGRFSFELDGDEEQI